MKINHIGYACNDIGKATELFCDLFDVKQLGPIIYDDIQHIYVRMIEFKDGLNIELVSGEIVNSFISKGTKWYHVCLECQDIHTEVLRLQESGAFLVVEPIPAKLFNNNKIAFLNTELGLIELLESRNEEWQFGNAWSENTHVINVVSNFTIEPIKDFFVYINNQLRNEFIFEYAPYNQVFQTLMDPCSIFNKNHLGYNVVVISMVEWLHNLSHGIDDCYAYFESIYCELIKAISSTEDESTLIITFCPCTYIQNSVVRELALEYERKIFEAVKSRKNTFCILSSSLEKQIDDDYVEVYANKLAHIPYSDKFYCMLSLSIMREVKRLQGYPYKVIVLDCDETLWNGIASETGAKKLLISEDKKKLQHFFLNQMRQGKLLCLCTKNSMETIEEVFRLRNDMPLKKEDFVSIKANWKAKYNNLQEIANELGLGLDSFIFVDDSLYECEQMKRLLPEVTTVHLPESGNITDWLEKQWIFDVKTTSNEGKKRTYLMNIEKERNKYRKQVNSLKDFIEGLNLSVKIMPIKREEMDRVSELSMRTNQFTLSGVKRTAVEFGRLVTKGYLIYTIYVTDRYGDYGLVGVIVFEPNTFCVDSFILSCRVLGRGVEHQVIKEIGNILKSYNISRICFKVKNTGRNLPAIKFISSLTNQEIQMDKIWVSVDRLVNFSYEPKEIEYSSSVIKNLNKSVSINSMEELQELDKVYTNVKKEREIQGVNQTSYEIVKWMYESLLGKNIGDDDTFFRCGGNSLLAVQLLNNIYNQFNVQIALRDFYEKSSINDMVIRLQQGNVSLHDNKRKPDISANHEVIQWFPLARAQRALWETEQSKYRYQNCMPLALELNGYLNISALQYAIKKAVGKHEALRTAFRSDKTGVFQTYIMNDDILPEIINCQNDTKEVIDRIVFENEKVSFDMEKGLLIHAKILVLSEKRHILLFNMHHLVFDGWSYGIFFKDVRMYYSNYGREATHLETKSNGRYIDFVKAEREYYMSAKREEDLVFWKKRLCDLQYTPLLGENIEGSGEGNSFYFDMSEDDVLCLENLAKGHCISEFSVFLSIYFVLLSFFTSTEDVATGTVVSLRDSFDYRDVVGLFINTIVMRCKIKAQYTFNQLLEQTWNIVLDSLKHKNAYFGDVIEQSGKSIEFGTDNPFYQTMFVFQNELHDELQLEGIETKKYKKGYDIARGAFVMEIHKCENRTSGIIYYDTYMFSKKFVKEFTNKFKQIVSYLTSHHEITVKDLFDFLREND